MQKEINEKIELVGKERVWIGDPCYVISDKLWEEVCEQIDGTEHEVNHIITFTFSDLTKAGVSKDMLDNCTSKKLQFIQSGTAYGDGRYLSNSGFQYGVDAGCLAVVPEYLIDPEKEEKAQRLGKFFDCVDFVSLRTDSEGEFLFSDANGIVEIIDTGDDYYEDDNYEDYEDDNYED
jgi:hypothetical protein